HDVPPGDAVALHELGQVVRAPWLAVRVNLRQWGSTGLPRHGCDNADSSFRSRYRLAQRNPLTGVVSCATICTCRTCTPSWPNETSAPRRSRASAMSIRARLPDGTSEEFRSSASFRSRRKLASRAKSFARISLRRLSDPFAGPSFVEDCKPR